MKKFYKKICSAVIISLVPAIYSPAYAAEYAIVSGRTVGIKIHTDGVIVAGVASFTDESGRDICPAREAGIEAGDIIVKVNGIKIDSCNDFSRFDTEEPLQCELMRNGEMQTISVTPKLSDDGQYRIGLWARDSAAGVGTLTYVNPENMRYSALGHAVADVDSESIMTVREGSLNSCEIIDIKHGHIGFPGSVTANFTDEVLGTVDKNGENGISGVMTADMTGDAVNVAESADVHNGAASVLSDVEGGGVMEYTAEIEVISTDGYRNMTVEITDERLINITGGIVQGMSGAPIMQDGQLVGAVTHVFVNNPRKGYAIFAENMAE